LNRNPNTPGETILRRVGEEWIVEAAQLIEKQNDDVRSYLPDLICSHDFVDYSMPKAGS